MHLARLDAALTAAFVSSGASFRRTPGFAGSVLARGSGLAGLGRLEVQTALRVFGAERHARAVTAGLAILASVTRRLDDALFTGASLRAGYDFPDQAALRADLTDSEGGCRVALLEVF